MSVVGMEPGKGWNLDEAITYRKDSLELYQEGLFSPWLYLDGGWGQKLVYDMCLLL